MESFRDYQDQGERESVGQWVTYRPACGGCCSLICRVIGNLVIFPQSVSIPSYKLQKVVRGLCLRWRKGYKKLGLSFIVSEP